VSLLPAWSEAFADDRLAAVRALPIQDAREWAFAGSAGAGVRLAVVDSGIDPEHPRVGGIQGAVSMVADPDTEDGYRAVEGAHEDLVGHGTACAAIIRSIAPEVEIYSVRVLGANLKGRGSLFHAGICWAVDHGMQVANLSLSSKSDAMFAPLHDIADEAYFKRTLLVAAANNQPGPTYPSQFSSVISVACLPGKDPMALAYNPDPPVEFGARGIDVDVAWLNGESMVASGNSFAAPHVAGMVALVLAKHPDLTPFQVKSLLQAVSRNAQQFGEGAS
jgi:subtilisin